MKTFGDRIDDIKDIPAVLIGVGVIIGISISLAIRFSSRYIRVDKIK